MYDNNQRIRFSTHVLNCKSNEAPYGVCLCSPQTRISLIKELMNVHSNDKVAMNILHEELKYMEQVATIAKKNILRSVRR